MTKYLLIAGTENVGAVHHPPPESTETSVQLIFGASSARVMARNRRANFLLVLLSSELIKMNQLASHKQQKQKNSANEVEVALWLSSSCLALSLRPNSAYGFGRCQNE